MEDYSIDVEDDNLNHRKAFLICCIMVNLAWAYEDMIIRQSLWEAFKDLFLLTSFAILYRKIPQ